MEWRTSLRVYASPVIGTLPVGSIDTSHVTKVLDPIWQGKTETASRIRGRIERVLDWARVRGYRAAGENPARWRGHLEETYPARGKVRPVKHHAAVPIDAMPALYERLGEVNGIAALALRFIILTAARAGEAVGATWPEVDLDEGVWTIPGSRMKAGRVHRVPLSREAVTILARLAKLRSGAHVFPGLRVGSRALSVRAILRALREAGEAKATVHGFRSTFQGLGLRAYPLSARRGRDGPRACRGERHRACLRSKRSVRAPQADDGGMGDIRADDPIRQVPRGNWPCRQRRRGDLA